DFALSSTFDNASSSKRISGLLIVALAAIGLNTRFANLKNLGLQPFLAGCFAALTVGIVSYFLIGVINP
ncbi:MAG: hypothetical protein VXB74_16130, partial [Deltaproteobacteria bacterium]